ncbi:hypothetical protein QVD17_27165 [Tagetes erecta]|uniref:Uncharacterized protein n=1 Tax=Tagetes erecta TaxID=13708 RepID=A0AAD8KAE8_TARER|nr:hypothetical protein QVD17_27165 [Tagetes erecta]
MARCDEKRDEVFVEFVEYVSGVSAGGEDDGGVLVVVVAGLFVMQTIDHEVLSHAKPVDSSLVRSSPVFSCEVTKN